jgi:hypothetical protein
MPDFVVSILLGSHLILAAVFLDVYCYYPHFTDEWYLEISNLLKFR